MASALVACSDDDPESSPTTVEVTEPPTTAPVTTDAPTTTEAPPTTEAEPTTEPPTTASPAPAPTSPPTTSFDEEALKEQIAADYLAADRRLLDIVSNPSLEALDVRVATAAAPGPLADRLFKRVGDLVALGDRVVPGEPPVYFVDVEEVEWDPSEPDVATLVVCYADNNQQITPGAGPNGEDVRVSGTGELIARRYEQHVVRTANGWLPDVFQDEVLDLWREVSSCPPA